jgi:hypothetical protein
MRGSYAVLVEWAPFGPAQPRDGIGAEGRSVVATLLEDHQSPSRGRDPPAGFVVALRTEREVAEWIEREGVEAERDDHHRTRDGHERLERAVERGEVGRVVRARRQWQVQVLAATITFTDLHGTPEVVGVLAVGITMEGDIADVAARQKICCVPLP